MFRALVSALLLTAPSLVFAQSTVARCPNILITFDISGSMLAAANNSSGQASTRLQVGRDAVARILAQNDTVTRGKYRYGLEVFGLPGVASGGNANCGISDASCSYSDADNTCRSVQASASSTAAINGVLAFEIGANWNTPTSQAITTAATRADVTDSSRDRYLLLITDGEPNCATGAVAATETALVSLRDSGVKTFVVGFGSISAGLKTNLNKFAVAGGTSRLANTGDCTGSTNACFYDASNGAELDAALQSIVAIVGGEFGGGGCDDSCYAHPNDCGAGQACIGGACVANPCAGVTCDSGSVCVAGQCQATCTSVCRGGTSECVNGTCVAPIPCSPSCSGENTICVQGQCVENYCSTNTLVCGEGFNCVKNACQVPVPPGGGGSNTGGDGNSAGGGNNNGSSDGNGSTDEGGAGCTSGASGALSLLGMLVAASSMSLLGTRRNRNKH